ncbi:protein asteroid homolog 1-like [Oppia nitens]|uniref:protein asteroid homolog 1-like n=1 Tax=Oppia nitens TaxID=1686743 RepID=UPI0023DB3110|nr:protein asteroid homolog 1-like [Oppia nitens]
MGVQGLTSFIKANKDRMITGYHLHDTYLVIDGNNFLYRLYENSNNQTKDNIYGGNYSRFAGNVHRFFTTLAKCRIRPVVVMDGGIDPSDQKIVKLLKKFTKNLRHAIDISNGNHFDGNIDIHPTLCRPVLEQMMDQLGVAYCQILYEADTYAAALANQLNCPILSGDSDFFVYNIIGGVILSDYLMNSMQVRQYEDQNNWRNRETYKYLDTKLYTIDNFVKCFPGLTSDCLPVFSTLMGNDYIEYDNIRPIVDTIPDVNNGQRNNRINISERHQQMIKILNWLRGLTRQQVIDYIESVLIEKSMNNVIELLKISIESYNIDNCSDGISYDRATNSFNWSKLAAHVMQKVLAFPQWFAIDMCKSRLNPMLINVSQAKRVFLSPRVEDLSLPSTYKCCWRLRQYLIGLMREDNDNDVKTVEVYDRYESEYKVLSMQSITVLTNNSGHQLPQLNQIINLTINEKTNLISEMLFDDKNVVKFMIKNTIKISDLQNQEGVYLMIVIRYWLGNTPNMV